jgi:hypothetical protein
MAVHRKKKVQQSKVKSPELNEPVITYTTRLRSIGNSRGVILQSKLIEISGLKEDAEIAINATHGMITIVQVNSGKVNTVLSSWDKQFKKAIKKGARPEGDLFHGMKNDFDENEW